MKLNSQLQGLCAFLVKRSLLKESVALDVQKKSNTANRPVIELLLEGQHLSESEIAKSQSTHFGLPHFDIQHLNSETLPQGLVSESLIRRHQVLPLKQRGDVLFVASANVLNTRAIKDLRLLTGLHIEWIVTPYADLLAKIEANLEQENQSFFSDMDDNEFENLDFDIVEEDAETAAESGDDDAPIVKFINKVILDGINQGASDIHFEPYEGRYRIRLRIDGILNEVVSPPHTLSARITSRLKIMSRLDIAERRVPQDGRFKMQLSKNRAIDFRVSTCPTLFGEKVVLRILDPSSAQIGIEALGYESKQKEQFLEVMTHSQGMILVTGPTGSGKTVSLYTALNILNQETVNISTAEDPVEINLVGINQVNINNKAGLNFASALRSFLRQDPDIVMVGEIRDLETAEIAVKAAQTGHLVLSTLHTNSAPETLIRLANMGVASYNIASAISLIMAQRLVRKLCSHCKEADPLAIAVLEKAGFEKSDIDKSEACKPKGCQHCTHGYSGRVGIFEVMPISEALQSMIMEDANALEIKKQAEKEGMVSLYQSGLKKVMDGKTSLEEIHRVIRE